MKILAALRERLTLPAVAWSLVLIVVASLLVLLAGHRLARSRVLEPSMSLPDHADAVVVFFGGEDRATTAADLMDTGIADTLVINHGQKDGRPAEPFSPLCDDPSLSYEVVCIVAEPSSTRGEAAAFAELAVERQWSTLIAYTSSFHLERARFLLDRCFDGVVHGQSVDTNNPTAVDRETRKLLVTWVLGRRC